MFDQNPETTLENIRLRICVDRKKQRRGTFLWSAARDTTTELVRLGLIEGHLLREKHAAIRSYEDEQASRYCRWKETVSASYI